MPGIVFHVQCPTEPGEDVRLVGSSHPLGDWTPTLGARLRTTPETYPMWASECLHLSEDVEYKYVVVQEGSEGKARWEDCDNRKIPRTLEMLEQGDGVSIVIVVENTFGDHSIQKVCKHLVAECKNEKCERDPKNEEPSSTPDSKRKTEISEETESNKTFYGKANPTAYLQQFSRDEHIVTPSNADPKKAVPETGARVTVPRLPLSGLLVPVPKSVSGGLGRYLGHTWKNLGLPNASQTPRRAELRSSLSLGPTKAVFPSSKDEDEQSKQAKPEQQAASRHSLSNKQQAVQTPCLLSQGIMTVYPVYPKNCHSSVHTVEDAQANPSHCDSALATAHLPATPSSEQEESWQIAEPQQEAKTNCSLQEFFSASTLAPAHIPAFASVADDSLWNAESEQESQINYSRREPNKERKKESEEIAPTLAPDPVRVHALALLNECLNDCVSDSECQSEFEDLSMKTETETVKALSEVIPSPCGQFHCTSTPMPEEFEQGEFLLESPKGSPKKMLDQLKQHALSRLDLVKQPISIASTVEYRIHTPPSCDDYANEEVWEEYGTEVFPSCFFRDEDMFGAQREHLGIISCGMEDMFEAQREFTATHQNLFNRLDGSKDRRLPMVSSVTEAVITCAQLIHRLLQLVQSQVQR